MISYQNIILKRIRITLINDDSNIKIAEWPIQMIQWWNGGMVEWLIQIIQTAKWTIQMIQTAEWTIQMIQTAEWTIQMIQTEEWTIQMIQIAEWTILICGMND